MIKLYLDFDGTLFNTDKFYQDFLEICLEYEITKEMVDKSKKELFSKSSNFNMDKLLNYFIKNYNINETIKEKVNKLYSPKYVFPDIICNLELLKDKYELIILTLGEHNYQMNKINGSGLKKYFKEVITTEIDKANLLNVDYKNSIFIDNNPNEIKKYLEKNVLKAIRIRRFSDKYSVKDMEIDGLEYKNFDEIIEYEL